MHARTHVHTHAHPHTSAPNGLKTLTLPSHSTSLVLQSSSELPSSHGTLPNHPPPHPIHGTKQPIPHDWCWEYTTSVAFMSYDIDTYSRQQYNVNVSFCFRSVFMERFDRSTVRLSCVLRKRTKTYWCVGTERFEGLWNDYALPNGLYQQ